MFSEFSLQDKTTWNHTDKSKLKTMLGETPVSEISNLGMAKIQNKLDRTKQEVEDQIN